MQILSDSLHRSKKDRDCNASHFVRQYLDDCPTYTGISFSDLRHIVLARQNNWKIKAVDIYRSYVIKQDGEIYRLGEIPEMARICTKYELWPDD